MEDLPAEVVVNIYKQLFEEDRRKLKLVSKRLHSCYRTFVMMSRKDPPRYLRICPYALVERPCNAVRKCSGPLRHGCFNEELYTIYHDCMCGYLAIVEVSIEWQQMRRDVYGVTEAGEVDDGGSSS